MEALRLKSQDEYKIPIDREDPITGEWTKVGVLTFDLSDTSLVTKMVKTFERIDELTAEYESKAKELDNMPDANINEYITANQAAGAAMIDQFYKDSRVVMDGFLGEGACQLIFGDKNYYDMFSDLTEQLQPHFEAMGLNAEQIKNRAANKHMPNRETRRAMK